MASPVVAGTGTLVGSALLALWVLARLPNAGPRTLRASFVLCGLAMVLLQETGRAMGIVSGATNDAVAVLGVAVPLLVFAFWAGGVLLRTFCSGLLRAR